MRMPTSATRWIVIAVAVVMTAIQPAESAPKASEDARLSTFAHAGVTVALPKGIRLRRPTGQAEIVSGNLPGPDGKPEIACTISAQPIMPTASLDEFVKVVRQSSLAVKKQTTLLEKPITVAGQPARRLVIRYTYRGEKRIAEMLFIRGQAPKGQNFALAYVVTLEGLPRAAGRIEAVGKALRTSWRFVPMVHPAEEPIRLNSEYFALGDSTAAIAAPVGWKVSVNKTSLTTYQTDFLAGAISDPKVSLNATDLSETIDAEALARQVTAGVRKVLGEDAFAITADRPATMGALGAHEIVMRAEIDGTSLVCVQRCAVDGRRGYTLAVTVGADKAHRAEALAEKLAQTFMILPPASTTPADTQAADPM